MLLLILPFPTAAENFGASPLAQEGEGAVASTGAAIGAAAAIDLGGTAAGPTVAMGAAAASPTVAMGAVATGPRIVMGAADAGPTDPAATTKEGPAVADPAATAEGLLVAGAESLDTLVVTIFGAERPILLEATVTVMATNRDLGPGNARAGSNTEQKLPNRGLTKKNAPTPFSAYF